MFVALLFLRLVYSGMVHYWRRYKVCARVYPRPIRANCVLFRDKQVSSKNWAKTGFGLNRERTSLPWIRSRFRAGMSRFSFPSTLILQRLLRTGLYTPVIRPKHERKLGTRDTEPISSFYLSSGHESRARYSGTFTRPVAGGGEEFMVHVFYLTFRFLMFFRCFFSCVPASSIACLRK